LSEDHLERPKGTFRLVASDPAVKVIFVAVPRHPSRRGTRV